MIKPPKCFSEAIDLALHDLAQVRKDPAYTVDMGVWHHKFRHQEKCSVCFAGSVMANSLGAHPERSFEPWDFSDGWREVLRALNLLRTGQVSDARNHWPQGWLAKVHPHRFDRDITSYSISPRQFRFDMLELSRDLKEVGT